MTNHSLDRLAPNGEATGRVDAAGRGADQGSPGDYFDSIASILPGQRWFTEGRVTPISAPLFFFQDAACLWLSAVNIWWSALHV